LPNPALADTRCAVEDCHVDAGQALGVVEHVDRDDLPVRNGERHDRQHSRARGDDSSGGPVDQRRSHERGQSRGQDRLCGHLARGVDHDGSACTRCPSTGPEHDVGIEDGNERVEVAVAGGG